MFPGFKKKPINLYAPPPPPPPKEKPKQRPKCAGLACLKCPHKMDCQEFWIWFKKNRNKLLSRNGSGVNLEGLA